MSTVTEEPSAALDVSPEFLARLDSELSSEEARQGGAQPDSGSTQAAATEETVQADKPSDEATPSSGTPDAPETKDTPLSDQSAKPAEPTAKEPSKFAKEQERRDKSWKALNEEKERFKAEQEQLRREREEWQQKQSAKPQFTPDDYQNYSKVCEERAAEKNALAEKLDEKGLYEQAEAARAEAKQWDAQAVLAGDESAKLKREQDMLAARQKQAPTQSMTIEQAQTHNWQLVAQHVPEFTQKGGAFNRALIEFVKANPQIMDQGDGPIVAARTVLKIMASRVPELESKVAELEKRNKELEEATSISGTVSANRLPGGPRSPSEMSDSELEQSLREDLNGAKLALM